MSKQTMLPCQDCINNTSNPQYPSPCLECKKYCYCYVDVKCNFCLGITGHVLKLNNVKKYIKEFPCYCVNEKKSDHLFLCLDCQQDFCFCDKEYIPRNQKKHYCSFCFEKEYNQMIWLGRKTDFPVRE